MLYFFNIFSLDYGKPFVNFQSYIKKVYSYNVCQFSHWLYGREFLKVLTLPFLLVSLSLNFLTSLQILFWVQSNHFIKTLLDYLFCYRGGCKRVPVSLLTIIESWASFTHSHRNVPLCYVIWGSLPGSATSKPPSYQLATIELPAITATKL